MHNFITGTAKQQEIQVQIKQIVSCDDFIILLKKALLILKPIDMLITYFQNDSISVSDVYWLFQELPATVCQMVLPHDKINHIIKLVDA